MLLIQYGCNKTYVLLTLIIDFDFLNGYSFSRALTLSREREGERKRDCGDDHTCWRRLTLF